ncbi:MAG: exodeoxyribonuclease VII small subunit [Parasporobacterium sp.]|nr:exodeoxyribonuclease VII small subunit [Parasporobacterium sp.]
MENTVNISGENLSIENLSIEETVKALEELTAKMQDPDLPLEDSFKLYKEGIALVEHANNKIEKIETDIKTVNPDFNA